MLRKIPDSVVPFARDGVISASMLGQAQRAERLEDFARKRATAAVETATDAIEQRRMDACQAGYREGFALALATLVPSLAEYLADEARLKAQVQQALERSIQRVLTDAEIEAALIAQCMASSEDTTTAGMWTVYIPPDRADLAAHLTARMPADVLRIRTGQAAYPVLERGEHVIEIDPVRSVSRQVGSWLDAQDLEERAHQRAVDYAAAVGRQLRADVRRENFQKLEKDSRA